MSATTSAPPSVIQTAPVHSTWRGRIAGWLARLATARRRTTDDALPADLGTRLSHDLGLPAGPSQEDRVWGVGGLTWR